MMNIPDLLRKIIDLIRYHATITSNACFFLAASLLVIPLPIIFAWLFSAFFHEISHLFALKKLGVKLDGIIFGASGMYICVSNASEREMLLTALAGPVGSFCLIFLWYWWPLVSFLGFLQGAYNIIPIYPLDGGRILRILLRKYRKKTDAIRIEKIVFIAVIFCLFLGWFCLTLKNINCIWLAIMGVSLIVRRNLENNLANTDTWGYNKTENIS